jgi:putative transposase
LGDHGKSPSFDCISRKSVQRNSRFQTFTARSIIDILEENHFVSLLDQFRIFKKAHKIHQEYQFWEEGSHPKMIMNLEMLNQKLDYIHYNPFQRGYVEDPSHWWYSSYVDYNDSRGLLPVEIIGL